MVTTCRKCGHEQTSADVSPADSCPKCGAIYAKVEAAQAQDGRPARSPIRKKKPAGASIGQLLFVSIGLLLAIAIFLGQLHIVRGSDYDGPLLVKKKTFGYSETFINTDEILPMPMISAKSKFPLSVNALQDVGFLETDVERKTRIRRKIRAEQDRIFGR